MSCIADPRAGQGPARYYMLRELPQTCLPRSNGDATLGPTLEAIAARIDLCTRPPTALNKNSRGPAESRLFPRHPLTHVHTHCVCACTMYIRRYAQFVMGPAGSGKSSYCQFHLTFSSCFLGFGLNRHAASPVCLLPFLAPWDFGSERAANGPLSQRTFFYAGVVGVFYAWFCALRLANTWKPTAVDCLFEDSCCGVGGMNADSYVE
jgi:hypothetical protein